MTFTKLFSSITESTIWCEDSDTRVVWITFLAMADRHGRVWGSIPGIANRARVSTKVAEMAINKFLSPDTYSRSNTYDPTSEGRRLEVIEGGWKIINHAHYRAIRDEEERRAYKTEHERKRRAKLRGQNGQLRTPVDRAGHNAEAEADTEAIKSKPLAQRKTLSEEIYERYPRKIGKKAALKAITKAIQDLMRTEQYSLERAVACLKERTTQFAESPAGQKGNLTAHPSTWFNRGSYLDDPKEWLDLEHHSNGKGKAHEREAAISRVVENLYPENAENTGGDLPELSAERKP